MHSPSKLARLLITMDQWPIMMPVPAWLLKSQVFLCSSVAAEHSFSTTTFLCEHRTWPVFAPEGWSMLRPKSRIEVKKAGFLKQH
jgi:hypothetical protein